MILDYLTRSVMAEVVVFGGSGLPRRARTFDDIVPGETVLSDVGGWFCTREAGHDEEAMFDFPLQRGDMFQEGQSPTTCFGRVRRNRLRGPTELGRGGESPRAPEPNTSSQGERGAKRSRSSLANWKRRGSLTSTAMPLIQAWILRKHRFTSTCTRWARECLRPGFPRWERNGTGT